MEDVNYYSLRESFDVILNKLDNGRPDKKDRYVKVYSKLKDFEEYMESLGVGTDFSGGFTDIPIQKDGALMTADEVIDKFKRLAIQHNISLMNKFNNETALATFLRQPGVKKTGGILGHTLIFLKSITPI